MTQLSAADAIPYLFERSSEPVFSRRGGDGDVQLLIPQSYYTPQFQNISTKLDIGGGAVNSIYRVKELNPLPDISLAASLPKRSGFSVFNDYHQECAIQLINLLVDAKNVDDFCSIATYAHDRVNDHLFTYSISIALLHRNDTKNIPLPSHLQTYPELYMDRSVLSSAREENSIVPEGKRIAIPIEMDYTATNMDLEHRVAYFREDVGVNLHHWHWHLVYPTQGRFEIVNKDRRGELFYYMHSQIIARYNMERLSNYLARVRRLADIRDPIEEGYYPKLDNSVAAQIWPSRHPNTRLSNLVRERDQLVIDIQDLERWRDRIFEAIHTGHYLSRNGSPEAFKVEDGIDVLGNMVEASLLSVNPTEYGNFHNRLHSLIAYAHDPENKYLESFGVMNESATAMRDPAFYRVHAYVNHMFEQYKATLPPYTDNELLFKDVQITKIELTATAIPVNEIHTFWQQADIDLSKGLDFSEAKGSVFARVTHLQHAPFQYNITVHNSGNARVGTVRIFYAPKYDEQGSGLLLKYQKSLFVELDRFTYNLQKGINNIIRRSKDSSVTIPYEQTFRNLSSKPSDSSKEAAYNFCGCGWPQHMLIAKGNVSGFSCELFVMITDYQYDQIQGSRVGKQTCDDASSYCGIRDAKYPDKRAMGYPFDRFPRPGKNTLKQFVTPNMGVVDVKIVFEDRIVGPIQNKGSTPIVFRSKNLTMSTTNRSNH